MSERRFEGKSVIVTGGASGIGKATAERFLEEGAKVAIIDVSREQGERALSNMKERGFDPLLIVGDVTSSSDVKRMVGEAVDELGRVDVLFNNAGILVEGTVEEVSEEDWDRVMAVNVKGVFLMTKEVGPLMVGKGGGVIINTASCSGLVGDRGAIAYNTSKGAVVLMTKCLALDYALKNVRVNCVCPGEIETPMFLQEVARSGMPVDKYRAELCELHPIGRLGRPDEVANAVLFLASEDGSFITGTALSVDGGYTCQ
ncbi:MAG: glucose 1-dehydrogenase [Methanobacteriota archaeon]|nr:MAG: glucose 1-dehydrogenase [Euryarchaeota archaeon]